MRRQLNKFMFGLGVAISLGGAPVLAQNPMPLDNGTTTVPILTTEVENTTAEFNPCDNPQGPFWESFCE